MLDTHTHTHSGEVETIGKVKVVSLCCCCCFILFRAKSYWTKYTHTLLNGVGLNNRLFFVFPTREKLNRRPTPRLREQYKQQKNWFFFIFQNSLTDWTPGADSPTWPIAIEWRHKILNTINLTRLSDWGSKNVVPNVQFYWWKRKKKTRKNLFDLFYLIITRKRNKKNNGSRPCR